jgi:hypothetical protein
VDSAVPKNLSKAWGSSAIGSDPGKRRRYFVWIAVRIRLRVSCEGRGSARRTRNPSPFKGMDFGLTTAMLSIRDDFVRESKLFSKNDPGQ